MPKNVSSQGGKACQPTLALLLVDGNDNHRTHCSKVNNLRSPLNVPVPKTFPREHDVACGKRKHFSSQSDFIQITYAWVIFFTGILSKSLLFVNIFFLRRTLSKGNRQDAYPFEIEPLFRPWLKFPSFWEQRAAGFYSDLFFPLSCLFLRQIKKRVDNHRIILIQ